MKVLKPLIGVALVALLAVCVAGQLSAQTGPSEKADSKASKSADQIPRAALLTERGRQLAEELRMLKRSRDSMGSKHPTLPLVNKKIEAIEEQLEAWEPAVGAPPPNPFHPQQEAKPQMNDYDLRQIVIRLTKRVELLEKRVAELEGK
ncbi:hypothetical protein Enr13x_30370 [Stieleria neptunia]|uniref:Uncharacterized protein n=1 Tax=Stieleria neptunia TaxID=2527979 RepID=A0A518HQQ7_9BACT|nr:hypothetical protein [Stieleria neptunia]QDV43182.1 hypothetical protein Enr13x_30370 [Stieleria neptunia]